MRLIKAPEGYEGCVSYNDATRDWRPAYRKVGCRWWTFTYQDAGHAHLPEDEVTRRAEAAIIHAISIREANPTDIRVAAERDTIERGGSDGSA